MITLSGLALLSLLGADPVQAQSQDLEQFALLEGDSLSVRFEPFCASRIAAGDTLVCEVAEDKVSGNRVLIAEGTEVKFKILEADGNGRPGKPGKMILTLESVEAVDGAVIPLKMDRPLKREGRGRNIVSKFLTLFLIKGTDPCILGEERFHPKFKRNMAVYLHRN